MWTATILDYENSKGLLQVSVQYINGDGTKSFIDYLDMSGQTIDSLTSIIQNKLSLLNTNDTLAADIDASVAEALQAKTSFIIQSPVVMTPPIIVGQQSSVAS